MKRLAIAMVWAVGVVSFASVEDSPKGARPRAATKKARPAANAFQFGPEMMANPAVMMNRGMALGSVMMDPFRPEHEREADGVATTWLYQEGYSPHGLADFFTRMNRRLRDQPDNPARSYPRTNDATPAMEGPRRPEAVRGQPKGSGREG